MDHAVRATAAIGETRCSDGGAMLLEKVARRAIRRAGNDKTNKIISCYELPGTVAGGHTTTCCSVQQHLFFKNISATLHILRFRRAVVTGASQPQVRKRHTEMVSRLATIKSVQSSRGSAFGKHARANSHSIERPTQNGTKKAREMRDAREARASSTQNSSLREI